MSELLIDSSEGPKGALAIACPFCHVPPGVDCVTERGRLSRLPHRRRFEAAARVAREGLWLLQVTQSGTSWSNGEWLVGRRDWSDSEFYEVLPVLAAAGDGVGESLVERDSVHPVRLLGDADARCLGLVEISAAPSTDPVPAAVFGAAPPATTWIHVEG